MAALTAPRLATVTQPSNLLARWRDLRLASRLQQQARPFLSAFIPRLWGPSLEEGFESVTTFAAWAELVAARTAEASAEDASVAFDHFSTLVRDPATPSKPPVPGILNVMSTLHARYVSELPKMDAGLLGPNLCTAAQLARCVHKNLLHVAMLEGKQLEAATTKEALARLHGELLEPNGAAALSSLVKGAAFLPPHSTALSQAMLATLQSPPRPLDSLPPDSLAHLIAGAARVGAEATVTKGAAPNVRSLAKTSVPAAVRTAMPRMSFPCAVIAACALSVATGRFDGGLAPPLATQLRDACGGAAAPPPWAVARAMCLLLRFEGHDSYGAAVADALRAAEARMHAWGVGEFLEAADAARRGGGAAARNVLDRVDAAAAEAARAGRMHEGGVFELLGELNDGGIAEPRLMRAYVARKNEELYGPK